VTMHIGPYEQLPAAGVALDTWVRQHGRTAAGPNWEVYWTERLKAYRLAAGAVNARRTLRHSASTTEHSLCSSLANARGSTLSSRILDGAVDVCMVEMRSYWIIAQSYIPLSTMTTEANYQRSFAALRARLPS
jgi:hypothetical protein